MKRWTVVGIAALGFCLSASSQTSTRNPHSSSPTVGAAPVQLGTVHFEISCAPGVTADFNRGVALLHSFWHDRAFLMFQQVAASDPQCAMAYWGQAMTHFHQLLATPAAADVQSAQAELALADRAQEKSPREATYIAALHRFFDGYRPENYQQHAAAYANAMATLATTYPHEMEAQVFYALALLSSDPPQDTAIANSRAALAILKPLFREHPNHPGIAHYIIHASDNPQLAPEGLEAARHYAQIAPQVPHALHMPAHIFTRMGLWQDDINSNLASKAAAEAAGLHRGAENRLHAMEFLEYAYLQTGRFDAAKAIVTEAQTIQPTDVDPRYPDMWASVEARYPAMLAIETKDWKTAEHLTSLDQKQSARQYILLLAHAEGAAHLDDRPAALDTQKQLESLESGKPSQIAAAIEAHAWIDFARGDRKRAIARLEPLADRQAAVGKGEVEIPAREMLAEMLLLSNQPAEALTQYRKSLSSDPNRFNALWGAAQAARQAGRKDLAQQYSRALLANCPRPQGAALQQLRSASPVR